MYIKKEVTLEEAKKHIENGEMVYTTDEDRGLGKTTSMLAYSVWSGKPVIVTSPALMKVYKELNPSATLLATNALEGSSLTKNGVLIDDIHVIDYALLLNDVSDISGFIRE